MKTQSRVLPALRCCLLGVPAWVVGRLVGRRLFLLRRRGTVSSSLGHRLPLLACPLRLVSVCDAVGVTVFSFRPLRVS